VDDDGLTTGAEWIVDARGCVEEGLRRLSSVQDFCGLVIRELSLKVVGEPQWHQFAAPGGVTGLYLLTESHLAVHTFPELGLITLNLYCCRPRREFDWTSALESHFRATDVRVIRIARGGLPVGNVGDSDDSISRSGIRQNSLTADDKAADACGLPLNEILISERPPHPALSPAGERELSAPNMAITQEAEG
jgi:S-adenosylmethionine decarboxylase